MPHIQNIRRFLAEHPFETCYEAIVFGRKVLVTHEEALGYSIDLRDATALI